MHEHQSLLTEEAIFTTNYNRSEKNRNQKLKEESWIKLRFFVVVPLPVTVNRVGAGASHYGVSHANWIRPDELKITNNLEIETFVDKNEWNHNKRRDQVHNSVVEHEVEHLAKFELEELFAYTNHEF